MFEFSILSLLINLNSVSFTTSLDIGITGCVPFYVCFYCSLNTNNHFSTICIQRRVFLVWRILILNWFHYSKRSHLKQIRSLSETLKNSPYATTVFWVWANALRVFRSFKHHKNLEPMANWEFIVGVFSHQQMGFNLLNPI